MAVMAHHGRSLALLALLGLFPAQRVQATSTPTAAPPSNGGEDGSSSNTILVFALFARWDDDRYAFIAVSRFSSRFPPLC